jgi:flagellar biosynthesis protein FlhF
VLVKKFTGKDMSEIMETVSRELGSDAVILSNRKVRQKGFNGLFSPQLTEATVAYDPQQTPAAKNFASNSARTWKPSLNPTQPSLNAPIPPHTSSNAPSSPSLPQYSGIRASEERAQKLLDNSHEQFTNLDRRISSLEKILSEFVNKFQYVKRDITYEYSNGVNELFMRLVAQQVDEALAHQIAKETDQLITTNPEVRSREAMEHLIVERLGPAAPIIHKKFTQKVVLMLGPTGVGKTTTIVKLAAEFSIKMKKRVGIINTDTYRIAAQEQIKTYSDILGVPLGAVYQMSELEDEIKKMADRELIFIDIAGKSPGDLQHREDIEEILKIARPEDVLLCVSATTNFSSMKETFDSYSYVPNYNILVTKLDETKYRGILLNICWYTRKRLSYLSIGQSVPDDIAEVKPSEIAGELLKDRGQPQ